MIVLFEVGTKVFDSNGMFTIHPFILTEVKEKSLNGWSIYSEIPIKYSDDIEDGMIAYVNTKSRGGQPFVISNIKRSDKNISFTGNHVVFESRNYILSDVRPTDMGAGAALNYVNQRTDIDSPFTTTSDVSNSQTAYFINKTLLEALDTIETRWGGTYDIDKFHISLKNSVGVDRGYNIIYGKNLEGLRVFEDWNNVVTKLLPIGFDGVTLPEKYLYSDLDYGKPYSKVIKFETVLEDDEKTEENLIIELRRNATEYLKSNELPLLSYEVDSNVDQELDIGDKVEVKHPIVTIDTEVISYEYDILSKRVSKLVFGNYKRDVKKKIDSIKESIIDIVERTSGMESILFDQTDLINSMNKFGHVYQDDNQILIVDTLPKEQSVNVWRWNLGGFAYSDNGLEGPYKHAWTMDGKFNTEFISANSIMTNMLHSDVGSGLDLSSNVSITNIVSSINNGNIIPYLNGSEELLKDSTGQLSYPGWIFEQEGLLPATDLYPGSTVYPSSSKSPIFWQEFTKGSLSKYGLHFDTKGTAISPEGYVVPTDIYSYRGKRGIGNQRFKIHIREYKALGMPYTSYFKRTLLLDANNPKLYEEESISLDSTTTAVRLEYEILDNDLLVLTEQMFNRGVPKPYAESAGDVKIFAEAKIKLLSDSLELSNQKVAGLENTLTSNTIRLEDSIYFQSQKINGLNNDIHNTKVNIDAMTGVTIQASGTSALTVKNVQGKSVFSLDTLGNIIMNDITANNATFKDAKITGNLTAGSIGGLLFDGSGIKFPGSKLALSSVNNWIDFGDMVLKSFTGKDPNSGQNWEIARMQAKVGGGAIDFMTYGTASIIDVGAITASSIGTTFNPVSHVWAYNVMYPRLHAPTISMNDVNQTVYRITRDANGFLKAVV